LCLLNEAQFDEFRTALQIAVQRGLLGIISPKLIAVTAGINEVRHITVVGYYLGDVGQKQVEEMDEVASEVIAALDHPTGESGDPMFATIEAAAQRGRASTDTCPRLLGLLLEGSYSVLRSQFKLEVGRVVAPFGGRWLGASGQSVTARICPLVRE
jgi:hypothetical protein